MEPKRLLGLDCHALLIAHILRQCHATPTFFFSSTTMGLRASYHSCAGRCRSRLALGHFGWLLRFTRHLSPSLPKAAGPVVDTSLREYVG